MKKQQLVKKITLNKSTLANLNNAEMSQFNGGGTYTCPGLNCPSVIVDCN